MHVIAAKAVAFRENLQPDFKTYSRQVIENASALASELVARGYNIISGGTDTHLMLIDLRNKNISGKDAQEALDQAGITVNKNAVPFDDKSPLVTSGIRIGTPAITTRGMKKPQMTMVAEFIDKVIKDSSSPKNLALVSTDVKNLCASFPLYQDLLTN